MKRILVFLVLLLANFQVQAQSQGLGVMLGFPTGLSYKRWLGKETAVDGGLGFTFGSKSRASLHSDYLFHNEGAFYLNDTHPLDLYYGLGGRMKFADDINLGVRVPVGLLRRFENDRADMFLEAAPIVDFAGKTGLDLHVILGSRYFF